MRRSRLRIGLLALLVLLALATAAGWLAVYLSQGRFDGAVARSGITGSPFTKNSDYVYNSNSGLLEMIYGSSPCQRVSA